LPRRPLRPEASCWMITVSVVRRQTRRTHERRDVAERQVDDGTDQHELLLCRCVFSDAVSRRRAGPRTRRPALRLALLCRLGGRAGACSWLAFGRAVGWLRPRLHQSKCKMQHGAATHHAEFCMERSWQCGKISEAQRRLGDRCGPCPRRRPVRGCGSRMPRHRKAAWRVHQQLLSGQPA
jgi:hypothetical protein